MLVATDNRTTFLLKKGIELINANGPIIIFFRTVKLANVKNYESKAQWHAGIPNSMELNDMLNMIDIKLEDWEILF